MAVDLREVSFLDSSGLRLLLQLNQELSEAGRRLVVVQGPRRVARVFELTGAESELDDRGRAGRDQLNRTTRRSSPLVGSVSVLVRQPGDDGAHDRHVGVGDRRLGAALLERPHAQLEAAVGRRRCSPARCRR